MRQQAAPTERCIGVSIELLSGPMVDGDRVAMRWRRGFVLKNGDTMGWGEITWQTQLGDRIAEETFIYDPNQRES